MTVCSEYTRARELLWELVDACTHRMRRSPHATPSLSRERDLYAAQAIRLDKQDAHAITRINTELPQRLAVLQGPVTFRD